jgi:hypothetical protein
MTSEKDELLGKIHFTVGLREEKECLGVYWPSSRIACGAWGYCLTPVSRSIQAIAEPEVRFNKNGRHW